MAWVKGIPNQPLHHTGSGLPCVAEVWFETREAMDRVFSTDEGGAARASATLGASELAILFTEEHIVV